MQVGRAYDKACPLSEQPMGFSVCSVAGSDQTVAALQQLQARCSASSSLAAERMNLMEEKAWSVLCLGPKHLNIYIAGAIAMSK